MIKSVLAISVAMALGSTAMASEIRRVDNPIEGRYIVVFKADAVEQMADEEAAVDAGALRGLSATMRPNREQVRRRAFERAVVEVGARGRGRVAQVFGNAIDAMVVEADEADVRLMMSDPRVDYVEQDGMVYMQPTQSNATWGLDRIDQRQRPLNGTYVYDYTGSGVRAYVIDSGILGSHTQFSGRMLSGYTAINDGRGTSDCNGHGTHVAGTIGGTTHGVAKSVRLVPVRVFGCTGGSSNSTIIAGIDWVRANHVKPAVANMSLGGPASSATDTATNNLINAGVTVVVAAGNNNANACNYSPARVANAITVGSTTSTDARSSFSNFGSCVNIFAPGSSITSAWHTSTSATNTISGTSMASPHVAGVAALYLGRFPSSSPATVRNWIYSNATTNVVTSPGSGSPNRLLYSR